jgi:CheY-like chemotaxis protein
MFESAAALVGKRVLVADDNADTGDSLAINLTDFGAEVHLVRDGRQALMAFPVFAPNVVVLDIGMPGMDGYAVARSIRARGPAKVMLIALTAWGGAGDKQLAAEAGFDHHLTKPADFGVLRSLIASA